MKQAGRWVLFTLACACTHAASAETDPYLWLEEVDGAKANKFVATQNAETQARFSNSEQFQKNEARVLEVLDAPDRIPYASRIGEYHYNFWRDADNPRGVWRRTKNYAATDIVWETVLDLDALGKAENENWVFKGASVYRPDAQRALVRLSRGGADAIVLREFDLVTKTFVENGFSLPEAKTWVSWYDADTVLIGTASTPENSTASGYPRLIRKWKRGTKFEDAPVVFTGKHEDIGVSPSVDTNPRHHVAIITRSVTYYEYEYFVLDGDQVTQLDIPLTAEIQVHQGLLFISLKTSWRGYAAGTVLTTQVSSALAGKPDLAELWRPAPDRSLTSFVPLKDYVLLNELINVKSQLSQAQRGKDGAWQQTAISAVDDIVRMTISAEDADASNAYRLVFSGFLTPQSLEIRDIDHPDYLIKKSAPSRFRKDNLTATQHWATSKDGTRIPYFQIGPKAPKNRSTILFGYGGFEVPLLPNYSATAGALWLEQGNVFVRANIRGGGEFGPDWHRAALRENRYRAYEDFIAVAEDLIARGVTTPKRLGVTGGSNGGLLVGNMLTMRPELFGAVVSQVPLLDMRRYNKLLAGASWVAEYGNPDDPEDWKFMRGFSPYHNLDPKRTYPPVLFTSSKRDDRVHPGHARKMAAKMLDLAKTTYYYENVEGGHAGAADNSQRAYQTALMYAFFNEVLD